MGGGACGLVWYWRKLMVRRPKQVEALEEWVPFCDYDLCLVPRKGRLFAYDYGKTYHVALLLRHQDSSFGSIQKECLCVIPRLPTSLACIKSWIKECQLALLANDSKTTKGSSPMLPPYACIYHFPKYPCLLMPPMISLSRRPVVMASLDGISRPPQSFEVAGEENMVTVNVPSDAPRPCTPVTWPPTPGIPMSVLAMMQSC